MNWKKWIGGIVAALASGMSDAWVLNMADPATFNMQNGLRTLLTVSGLFAVKALVFYLKEHPIPEDRIEDPRRLA